MKAFVTMLSVLCVTTAAVQADTESPNRPVVHSSEYGVCYARSIPSGDYGTEGVTRVYGVGAEEDRFLHEYPWYGGEMYLGGDGDASLVRMGPWARGREPSADHLAIGLYRDGLTIREYSTLEVAELGSGVQQSMSHYQVFGERLGFGLTGDALVFEVLGVEGDLFAFDLETGELIR